MQTPSLEQLLQETQAWLHMRTLLAELVLNLHTVWPAGQVPRQAEVDQLRHRARQLGKLLHGALRMLAASQALPNWLRAQAAALGIDASQEHYDDSESL